MAHRQVPLAHPGTIMLEDWLKPMGISQYALAPAASIACAASAFADPNRIVRQDTRHVYGETRDQLIGRIDNRIFILVYTPRHDVIRIISARKVRVHAKWPAIKIVRRTIAVNHPTAKPVGRINRRRVDATTESDIAAHKAADDC